MQEPSLLPSYNKNIYPLQVESLVLQTISQSLLETMEEESEFAGANQISNLKLE